MSDEREGMSEEDVRLAMVITWAINMVVCDECGAKWGEPCDNGLVHPERVTKAFFSEMVEPLVIDQAIQEAGQ